MWFRRPRPQVSSITSALPRSELLRRGRVAVLDDETPEMLKDLQEQGFSISHLRSTSDPQFSRLAEAFYDIVLLDYGGIGATFGQDEGLDVLRYLKRVNPGLRVLAFTARTFDASKADFFRLCDGIVKKDAGIRETMEHVEFHLAAVLTPAYQFDALKRTLNLTAEQARELDSSLSKAVAGGKSVEDVLPTLRKLIASGSEKLVETIVKKIIEYGLLAAAASI